MFTTILMIIYTYIRIFANFFSFLFFSFFFFFLAERVSRSFVRNCFAIKNAKDTFLSPWFQQHNRACRHALWLNGLFREFARFRCTEVRESIRTLNCNIIEQI